MNEGRHAVVIGAGIGGLLAARVLTEHYDRVTVVDRDRLPEDADHRAGVPQSQHAHGMLPRGARIVEELFPELQRELRADGAAVAADVGVVKIVTPMGLLPLHGVPDWASDEALFCSRFLLEWRLRQRLCTDDRVRVLSGLEVVGLAGTGPGPTRDVRGVRIRRRPAAEDRTTPDGSGDELDDAFPGTVSTEGEDGRHLVIDADLVVDASGRRSRAPEWLAELGHGQVAEETLHSQLNYASRFYARPADFPGDFQLVIINGRPPNYRGAGLVQDIENDVWHVTLGGLGDDIPPTDEDGFLRRARDLPDPSMYEAIRVARPLTPIRGWRTPTNRLRHFERQRSWPRGFIATGDSVCSLNPIYGQGMTVAAMDALVLRRRLAADESGRRAGFEKRFQRHVAREVSTPWMMASTEDLRWPEVRLDGAPPRRGMAFGRAWMDLLLRAAVDDPRLANRYFEVIGFIAPLRSVFAPRVIARVLVRTVRRWVRPRRTGPGPFALSPESLAQARELPGWSSAPESVSEAPAATPSTPVGLR